MPERRETLALFRGTRDAFDLGRAGIRDARLDEKAGRLELTASSTASPGRIFLIDDNRQNRQVLRGIAAPAGYRIEEFESAGPALDRLRADPPDLIFLGLRFPDRSGLEVLEQIRSDPATRLLPVCIVAELWTFEEKIRVQTEGVTDFLTPPFSPDELLPRIRSLIELKQFADEHEHAEHVILTLAKTIDARDPFTAGHSGRVAECADQIAEEMGLEPVVRSDLRRAALLHDLGKIVIADEILRKPGPLTPQERGAIETHPTVGIELLSPMKTMRQFLPVIGSHHERLDGSGYPQGLSGGEIPLTVRIVTVADVFDALTTTRAYQTPVRTETALEILEAGVGKGWWDREVLKGLRSSLRQAARRAPNALLY